MKLRIDVVYLWKNDILLIYNVLNRNKTTMYF